jgi:TonB family protein
MFGKVTLFCDLGLLGFALFALFSSQPLPASIIDDSAVSRAVSTGKTYDIFSLNDNKNQIPTGTVLSVKGLFFQITWTKSIRCDQLLMYGHAIVQHGEANPSSYCRFSVSLTEKRADGGDTFPVYGAICDVTPSELKKDLKLYRYGDQIQAHGIYAPSLDFAISPVGVPRLNNCTVASSTERVVRPLSIAPAPAQSIKEQTQDSEADSNDSTVPNNLALSIADITLTRVAYLPEHIVFHEDSIVVGHKDPFEDDLYAVANVRIVNRLKVPLHLNDITVILTAPDGTQTTASAANKEDLPKLYVTFPAIKPVVSDPIQRGTILQPGEQNEGMVLFTFPITQAVWDQRKSAVISFDFINQTRVNVLIPTASTLSISTIQTSAGIFNIGTNTDFGTRFATYVQQIQMKVAAQWYINMLDPQAAGHRVFITFQVERDGSLTHILLAQRSGDATLDLTALNAVRHIDTFGPLPDAYTGNHINVMYYFDPPPHSAAPTVVQTEPASPAPTTPPATSPSGTIMVQIAAVSSQDVADILLTSLQKKGYSVSVRHEPQDKLLHVQIGPFATRQEAVAMQQRVLADGFNAIVK